MSAAPASAAPFLARFRPRGHPVKPQADALWQVKGTTPENNLPKRAGLRERASRVPARRTVLADGAKRGKKLAVETGYDMKHGRFLARPLQAWTCPDQVASKFMYRDLLTAGQLEIERLTRKQFGYALWMIDEQLAVVSEDGKHLEPLSDASAPKGRSYPGAPVPDGQAKAGRQLRGHAAGLVMAAFANLSRGVTAARSVLKRRKGQVTAGGIRLSAAQLAAEANALKRKRPDLEEYRYLSVSVVRRAVRELIGLGDLEVTEPPHAVRRERSWRMIAAVFALLAQSPDASPG